MPTMAPSTSEDEAASADDGAHGTDQLLMENGDEGTVAEGLKLSPRHPADGQRTNRPGLRSYSKRAHHRVSDTTVL